MPKSGPQFLMLSCNPSAGWVYKRLVRPLKLYQERGIVTDDLLCERDKSRVPVLGPDGKPILMIELFEAPTHANYRNLSKRYITTLESTYQGQMYDRYLMGEWASYEGLVYPQWSDLHHVIPHADMLNQLDDLTHFRHYNPNWIEGYDFGIIPDEMASYMWKRDNHDIPRDEPVDANDHALDTIKYMLSDVPDVGEIINAQETIPDHLKWHVYEREPDQRKPRYG
jgi:hypothetical protein